MNLKRLAIWTLACVSYVAGWTWNVGVALSDMNYEGAFGQTKYMCAHYKHDIKFAMAWSLIPISWIEEPILGSGYYRGWRVTQLDECKSLSQGSPAGETPHAGKD